MLKTRGVLFLIASLGVAILVVAGWLAYAKIETEVKASLEKSLNTVLHTSHKALLAWSIDVKQQATTWASLPLTKTLVEHLAGPAGHDVGFQDLAVFEKQLLPFLTGHDFAGLYIYRKDNLNVTSFLNTTPNSSAIYGQNKAFFKTIWLGHVALTPPKRLLSSEVKGKVVNPLIFVGAPIFDQNGAVTGALVLSLRSQARFSKILQRGRIGDSGETYAFNDEAVLISASRFENQLRRIGLMKPGQGSTLNIDLHDPGINLVENGPFVGDIHERPLTFMARQALKSQNGANMDGYNNYRGVKVVGAWLWNETLGFGLATEIDVDEAHSFLITIFNVMVGLTIISSGLVVVISLIFVKGREKLAASEEDLSITLNCIGDGVIATDVFGNVMRMNPMAENLSGWTIDEAIGRPLSEVFVIANAITQNPVIDPVQKVIDSGEVVGLSNHTMLTSKSGEIFQIADSAAPIRNGKSEIMGVVLVFRDVTGEYTMAEDLNTALADAERANQAKSEFLASMSHELRTPMNAVLGFAQMLQYDPKHPLSVPQNEYVESILSGGHHLLELINEILDLARIESDHLPLTIENVDACEVIEECVDLLLPLSEPQNIEILNTCDMTQPVLVRTDRLRFKQALLNLHSNAVKYNKEGGKVTIRAEEQDPGFLRIYVTDTGVGIPEDEHDAVFNMFHRLGVDPTIAREGTGIGLTVTKLLMERMAGHVGFESKEGVGSSFWIEVPLASNTETLIWSDTLQVGVDAIDKDHQVIIRILNKISRSSIQRSELGAVIEELWDYTQYHFRREEKIMEVCGYTGLAEHRVHHQKLISEVTALTDEWHTYDDDVTLQKLRTFLRRWWVGHIATVDAKISKYAKGKDLRIRKALKELE